MARRSSQVSVGSEPAPAFAPPDVFAPDDTMSTFVPIDGERLLDAGARALADRDHGDHGARRR